MTNPERAELIMAELRLKFNEIGNKYNLERDSLMLMVILKSMADAELLALKGKREKKTNETKSNNRKENDNLPSV